MKKVSFRVRNFEKEQFLTYNIDNEADLDEDVLDYLEDEEPDGIVPIIFDDENDDYDTFSYDVTDKIHLLELSNQEINAEMVLMVMRGLVLSLSNMAEYRIPLSYLVLHKNYIYIDSDYKVEFICIPLEDMQEEVDVAGFLRGFLAGLRFDSSENGDYVAKLLTYINNSAIFSLHSLLTLVEELMDDYGIDIPEDTENGIYVDYQEVNENAETDTQEELDEPEEDEDAEPEDVIGQTTILTQDIQQEPEAEEAEQEETEDIQEPDEREGQDESDEEAEDLKEASENLEETSEEADALEEAQDEEEDVVQEAQDKESASQMMDKEPEDVIDQIKQQVLEEKAETKDSEESPEKEAEEASKEPAEKKKTSFKTKEPSGGVVIYDELDEFLAEKEKEEMAALKEDSGIKMKKNIKVSRASIVKNTQDELKAADDTGDTSQEESKEEETSGSILSQTIGATGILKGPGAVPKANPYLVRVNTEERIMITKQTFKIGKASMGVDYTVKGNGAVSRVHAIISNRDDVYYIKDNKSTNHTYVNGRILDEGDEELLTHDSRIMLGDEEFVFKLR